MSEDLSGKPAEDPFDRHYIQKNYIDLGCEDVLIDVFGIFEESAPKKLVALHAALADKNLGELRQIAHSMKGESGSVGGKDLRLAAENLEKAARADDLQQVTTLLPALEFETARLLQAIKKELAKK